MNAIKRKIAAMALGSVLKSLATSKNTQTTITGMIAAVVLGVHGLDLGKLIEGDPAQIAHVVSAVMVFFIGLLATRQGADGKTTLLGAVAGTLRAMSGDVTAIAEGVIIAALGHLTNKGPEANAITKLPEAK